MKYSVILSLLNIHFVECQFQILYPKPEKCYGSPELLTRQCCVFPPFFKREVAKGCGGKFAVMFINNAANVTGLRREANNPCEYWECVLREYSLLTPEKTVNDAKLFTHLDNWVDLNPKFKNVMKNAQFHCKHLYRMFMPLKTCEYHFFQSCIRNYITVNCPWTINTIECQELTDFYEECRQYYETK